MCIVACLVAWQFCYSLPQAAVLLALLVAHRLPGLPRRRAVQLVAQRHLDERLMAAHLPAGHHVGGAASLRPLEARRLRLQLQTRRRVALAGRVAHHTPIGAQIAGLHVAHLQLRAVVVQLVGALVRNQLVLGGVAEGERPAVVALPLDLRVGGGEVAAVQLGVAAQLRVDVVVGADQRRVCRIRREKVETPG